MSADDRWPMSYESSAADAAHAASEIDDDDQRADDLDPARMLVYAAIMVAAVAFIALLLCT